MNQWNNWLIVDSLTIGRPIVRLFSPPESTSGVCSWGWAHSWRKILFTLSVDSANGWFVGRILVCVLLCLIKLILGIGTVLGYLHERAKGLRTTDVHLHPVLPYTTWNGWMFTLRLNHVAGYTIPVCVLLCFIKPISLFLCWVAKTQPNRWTKRLDVYTLFSLDPTSFSIVNHF